MTERYQYNINLIDLQVPLDPQIDITKQISVWITKIEVDQKLRLVFKNKMTKQDLKKWSDKIQTLNLQQKLLIEIDGEALVIKRLI